MYAFRDTGLTRFVIFNTQLTSVDLTPFVDTTVPMFEVISNYNLTKITGPPLQSFSGSINVSQIDLYESTLLDDVGFGNTLKYFNSSNLEKITISKTQLRGSSTGPDLLPGLSALTQLKELHLAQNEIRKVGGGQFNTLTKLESLQLHMNELEEIGRNVFQFFQHSPQVSKLDINVHWNNLTSENIHKDHGLDKISPPVRLYIQNNQLDTLSADIFESFLRAEKNSATFLGNRIICDERVKWLKDEREFFESRVAGADCVNDIGATVFTSTLIP
jgi:hypothetical protein